MLVTFLVIFLQELTMLTFLIFLQTHPFRISSTLFAGDIPIILLSLTFPTHLIKPNKNKISLYIHKHFITLFTNYQQDK